MRKNSIKNTTSATDCQPDKINFNVLILSLFIFYNFLFHSSVCKCIDSVLSYMYNHDTGIYIQVTFITDM